RRLALLIWGTDFDPALRPLLAAGFCETLAGSAAWPFLGIWALERLGASQVKLSAGFLLGALASIASGWLGGHLSDYVGRRPVMLAAEVGFMAVPLAMIAVGHQVIAGLAVMASFGVTTRSCSSSSPPDCHQCSRRRPRTASADPRGH